MNRGRLTALLLLLGMAVCGEVYWSEPVPLRPPGGGGGSPDPAGIWRLHFGYQLCFREAFTVNGVPLEIESGVTFISAAEVVGRLAMLQPQPDLTVAGDILYAAWPCAGGGEQRLGILILAPKLPAVIFAMKTPPGPLPPPEWPPELPPPPPGARPETVQHYPARGAWYGHFTGGGSRGDKLAALAPWLSAGGWEALDGEELFFHVERNELLLVAADDEGGIMYRRELENNAPEK